MKAHEILYLISIFLIILSIAFYMLSTTVFTTTDEDGALNLLGKNAASDSLTSAEDLAFQLQESERARNFIILWIGISVGIVTFCSALFLKRKKHGPDLFIDREVDDEESDTFF